MPQVYGKYQRFGKNFLYDEPPAEDAFTPEEFALLMDVVREYGCFSTSALVCMSRADYTPWAKVYKKDKDHIPLGTANLRNYFKEQKPLPTFRDVLERKTDKISFVSPMGYTEEGIAIFPKEEQVAWGEWDG